MDPGLGTGAGGNVDELEELAERINKAARTPATTVRDDPLPDWLQPFDENLANNEGDEQKEGDTKQLHRSHQHPQLQHRPCRMTMTRRLSRSMSQTNSTATGKSSKCTTPSSRRRRRCDSTCCPISRIEVGVTTASEDEDESVTIEDGLKITSRRSRSTT